MSGLVRRLGRIAFGYLTGLICAIAIVTAFTAWQAESPYGWFQTVLYSTVNLSLWPFVICVVVAESLSIRTLFYYSLCFFFPAALLWMLGDILLSVGASVAALAASLAYWLVAGRFAGRGRSLPKGVSPSEP